MNKTMVVGLTAALLVGCGEPKSQQENRLAITQQNVSGAWQCDYKLTDIKTKVYVSYGKSGDFSGRVFLNYPLTTGKSAVKVELVTSGSWHLEGVMLTERFEVLSMVSANSNGNALSEPLAKALREYQLLTTEVLTLSASTMTLKEIGGEQTQCIRRTS